MKLLTENTQSPAPARLLILSLLSMTILLWPGLLGRLVSLDWQIGNVRPAVYGIQGILAAAIIVSWLSRNKINAFYSKAFPSRRTFLLAVGCCGLSFLLGLGIAEFVCRLLDFPFKHTWTPSENALAQFDPEVGWAYVPNRSVVQTFGSDPRKIAMHFSSIGSRAGSPAKKFDDTAPTMIFVGDSFTMGHGLDYDETIGGIFESIAYFPLQVVNLGVQGYGTDQALLLLKRYFSTFETKVVVYSFICDHLKRNANYDRRHIDPQARFLGTKPLFALRRDGTLYLKKMPLRYEDLDYSPRLWGAVQVGMTNYGPPPAPDLTRALVQEMRDYVSSQGATFILLDWKWKIGRGCNNDDYFRGINLNVVDAADKAPSGWRSWTVPGDKNHPDFRANRYVARRLLDELKRLDLVPDNIAYVTPKAS